MSKYLNLDGLGTFWTKIKNTFVKKNDNGYVDKSQIPVKSYRAGNARAYVRICRCIAPNTGNIPTIDCNVRMGDATVRIIIQGYNAWRANVIGYLNNTSFKFYAHQVVVGEDTFYDIIAYHTTYSRGFYSSQFLYDYDVIDFSYWAAPYTEYTPTSEEEIPYIMLAKSTDSSGNSPVKVNAYGDLSPITVDSTPTAGHTSNLVSSDGIKNALDGKANSSDIPQATTTSPKMDGTASAGSETKWAKGDHVHPTDTSREAVVNKEANTVTTNSTTKYPSSQAVATYVGTAISNGTAANANNVNVKKATTTTLYLTGVEEDPGTSGSNKALKTDTGIYADTTAGRLVATEFKLSGGCTLQYNSTTKSLDFVFG